MRVLQIIIAIIIGLPLFLAGSACTLFISWMALLDFIQNGLKEFLSLLDGIWVLAISVTCALSGLALLRPLWRRKPKTAQAPPPMTDTDKGG